LDKLVLALTARTATTKSEIFTNVRKARGLTALLLLDSIASGTVLLKVHQVDHLATGAPEPVIAAGAAALSAAGAQRIMLAPGLLAGAGPVDFYTSPNIVVNSGLPFRWRISVVHSGSNSATYEVYIAELY